MINGAVISFPFGKITLLGKLMFYKFEAFIKFSAPNPYSYCKLLSVSVTSLEFFLLDVLTAFEFLVTFYWYLLNSLDCLISIYLYAGDYISLTLNLILPNFKISSGMTLYPWMLPLWVLQNLTILQSFASGFLSRSSSFSSMVELWKIQYPPMIQKLISN